MPSLERRKGARRPAVRRPTPRARPTPSVRWTPTTTATSASRCGRLRLVTRPPRSWLTEALGSTAGLTSCHASVPRTRVPRLYMGLPLAVSARLRPCVRRACPCDSVELGLGRSSSCTRARGLSCGVSCMWAAACATRALHAAEPLASTVCARQAPLSGDTAASSVPLSGSAHASEPRQQRRTFGRFCGTCAPAATSFGTQRRSAATARLETVSNGCRRLIYVLATAARGACGYVGMATRGA